jgi:hypothetical protein
MWLREPALVDVAQAAEVHWEDVKEARVHEECRARNDSTTHAHLHGQHVHAQDHV